MEKVQNAYSFSEISYMIIRGKNEKLPKLKVLHMATHLKILWWKMVLALRVF